MSWGSWCGSNISQSIQLVAQGDAYTDWTLSFLVKQRSNWTEVFDPSIPVDASHALDGPVRQNASAARVDQAIRSADNWLDLPNGDHAAQVVNPASRRKDLTLKVSCLERTFGCR
jgi:hypothetical protein